MKYKLRFFVNKGQKHSDCGICFATLKSEHVPKRGQLIYLSDDCTDRSVVKAGQIYRVIHSVYCFDDVPGKDGCNSVEVVVRVADV